MEEGNSVVAPFGFAQGFTPALHPDEQDPSSGTPSSAERKRLRRWLFTARVNARALPVQVNFRQGWSGGEVERGAFRVGVVL
jgi:hypothetical protein